MMMIFMEISLLLVWSSLEFYHYRIVQTFLVNLKLISRDTYQSYETKIIGAIIFLLSLSLLAVLKCLDIRKMY